MKLDLVSPMVGANYRGFIMRFERGGAHRSDEQWDVRHEVLDRFRPVTPTFYKNKNFVQIECM
jgi:hypothetical protein